MENNIEMNNSVENTAAEAVNELQTAEITAVKKRFPVWIVALCAAVAVIVVAVIALMPKYSDYNITVIDEIGNPISNVMVTITDSKGETKTRITDSEGKICFPEVLVGVNTVTVEKGLSEITVLKSTYTLDKKTKVLRVLVRDDKKAINIYGNIENDAVAYNVSAGSYNLPTTAGNTSYIVFNAYQTGVYKVSFISNDPDMTVGYYGMPMYVQTNHCGELDYDGKSFELIIQDTNTPYVIGVNCVNTADAVLTIERTADAPFDPQHAPWTQVEAKENFVQCVIPSDKQLTDIDITDPSVSVVLKEDGYYYTTTGHLVYLRIGSTSNAKYLDVSIAYIAGLVDKSFGQNFGGYVYDEDGEFVGKYSFNDMLKSYFGYIDNDGKKHPGYCDSNGVYPLTAELAEAIIVHGNSVGWWNPDSGNYLFDGVPVAKDNLWLFLCCTAQ